MAAACGGGGGGGIGPQLQNECGHHGHVLALHICAAGEHIAVGDLMRSVALLRYNSIDSSIDEIARDYNTNWMTALELLDGGERAAALGAENEHNLFVVRRRGGAGGRREA